MIKWDDAITIMQSLANDDSASTLTFLKLMANEGYKKVLAKIDVEDVEEEAETVCVIGQRAVQPPVGTRKISNVIIVDGTSRTPLVEIKSRTAWERITGSENTGIPQFYHVQPRKGLGGIKLHVDPKPGLAYTMVLVFESTAKSLSQEAYTTGTAAINKDSVEVTGTGTTFTPQMVGRYIKFTAGDGDGMYYKVISYTSATVIEIENYYEGENYSGTYEIVELFELPEDAHMAPLYYSLWHYYATRRDKQQAAIYKKLYEDLTTESHEINAVKTRDNDIIGLEAAMLGNLMSDYPDYFPADGIG